MTWWSFALATSFLICFTKHLLLIVVKLRQQYCIDRNQIINIFRIVQIAKSTCWNVIVLQFLFAFMTIIRIFHVSNWHYVKFLTQQFKYIVSISDYCKSIEYLDNNNTSLRTELIPSISVVNNLPCVCLFCCLARL